MDLDDSGASGRVGVGDGICGADLRDARSGAGRAGSAVGGVGAACATGAGGGGVVWTTGGGVPGTGRAVADGAVVVTDVVTVGAEGITNCQYANAMSPIPMTTAPTAMPMPPPRLLAVLGGTG